MRHFTSDTHYGHQNIIRFCDRPFENVDHMNVDLVNRAAKGRMINVGVDAWGGRPVSEVEVIELVEAGPTDLGVLPWETR